MGLFHIPLHFLFFQGSSLIVFLLTLCQRNFHFGFAPCKIDFGGNQGIALLFGFSDQPFDFPFVQEKFPYSHGIHFHVVGKRVRGNVHVMKENLTTLYLGITIHQVGPSLS